MIETAIFFAFSCVGVALLFNLHRLLAGPSLPDRILALDTLYINAIALVMLAGLHFRDKSYFEAAILIAMLGFIGTVALCKYCLRGDIIE